MMTVDDIEDWLSDPSGLASVSAEELLSLRGRYPFCEPVHWLVLRKMYDSGDIRLGEELARSSVHISDRRALYNFLHYEATAMETNVSLDTMTAAVQDYFAVEGNEEQRKTLQELAARLKEARMARKSAESAGGAADEREESRPREEVAEVKSERPREESSTAEPEREEQETDNVGVRPSYGRAQESAEADVKRLIREKKYSEALRILKAIDLHNSPKSSYFALQIKYIETILANSR